MSPILWVPFFPPANPIFINWADNSFIFSHFGVSKFTISSNVKESKFISSPMSIGILLRLEF